MSTPYRQVSFQQVLPSSNSAYANGGTLEYNFQCSDLEAVIPSMCYLMFDIATGDADVTTAMAAVGAGVLKPYFPMRMISQASHIINGSQIANSNECYSDALTIYNTKAGYGQRGISADAFSVNPTTSNWFDGANLHLACAARPPMPFYGVSDPIFGGRHTLRLTLKAPAVAQVFATVGTKALEVSSIKLYVCLVKPQADVRLPRELSTPIRNITTRLSSSCATGTSLTETFTIPVSTYACVIHFSLVSDSYNEAIPAELQSFTCRFRGMSIPSVPYTDIFLSTTNFSDRYRAFVDSAAALGSIGLDSDQAMSYSEWSTSPWFYVDLSHRTGDETTSFQLQFSQTSGSSVRAVVSFLYNSRIDQEFDDHGSLKATQFIEDSV